MSKPLHGLFCAILDFKRKTYDLNSFLCDRLHTVYRFIVFFWNLLVSLIDYLQAFHGCAVRIVLWQGCLNRGDSTNGTTCAI